MGNVAGKDFSPDLPKSDTQTPVPHGSPCATVGPLLLKAQGKSSCVSRIGTVSAGGASWPVRGEVWFDHQWGDFDPAVHCGVSDGLGNCLAAEAENRLSGGAWRVLKVGFPAFLRCYETRVK